MLVYMDTGGNHRSAAEAVTELLESYADGRNVEVTHADVFKLARVYPFRTASWRYKMLSRYLGLLYEILFRITDNVVMTKAIARAILRVYGARLARVIASVDPDVIVVLHPLFVADVLCDLRIRYGARWRIISLVTDLGVVHAGWATAALDSVLMVSPGQVRKLRKQGCLPADTRVAVTVAPVRAAFNQVNASVDEKVMAVLDPKPPYLLYIPGLQPSRAITYQVRRLAEDYGELGIVLVGAIPRRLVGRLRKISPGLVHLSGLSGLEMAVLFRNAELAAGKTGPAVMAEAARAGARFLPTAEVGRQEEGNALIGRSLYGIEAAPPWMKNRWGRDGRITPARVPSESHRMMGDAEVRRLIIDGLAEMAF
jgi:1,2-diacylglycerol 3-beta-galactosyltransferase